MNNIIYLCDQVLHEIQACFQTNSLLEKILHSMSCFMNTFHCNFQIIEMTDYRAQLYDYLKNRMTAIAPNLTVLVGELVGARLIAHAGELK